MKQNEKELLMKCLKTILVSKKMKTKVCGSGGEGKGGRMGKNDNTINHFEYN